MVWIANTEIGLDPKNSVIKSTCSFYIQNFQPEASFWSRAGHFESNLVGNPEDRYSRDEAHMIMCSL